MLRFQSMKQYLMALIFILWAMAPGVTCSIHAQPPPERFFAVASVDNHRPYLGQQITYTLQVYLRSGALNSTGQLGQIRYEPPDLAGLWTIHLPESNEYMENVDSQDYRVLEIKTALFPSVVGPIEIGASTLTLLTGTNLTPETLESETLSIEARPLPPDAPAGFVGAVGTFEISAVVDNETTHVNEPVELTVRVSGEGNIEALPDPSWPEFPGWRIVEFPTISDSQVVDGYIKGTRTYKIAMLPTRAGQLPVPEIAYIYFEPKRTEYVAVSTEGILLTVLEMDATSSFPPPVEVDVTTEGDGLMTRDIMEVPSPIRQPGWELTDTTFYWAAWAIPALLISGAVVWSRKRNKEEAARASVHGRNALPNSRAALARAEASGNDPRSAAADVLLFYLSHRLGTPLIGLTRESLSQRLRNAGVHPELVGRVEDALAAGDAAKFSPQSPLTPRTVDQFERVDKILTDLDGAMGP